MKNCIKLYYNISIFFVIFFLVSVVENPAICATITNVGILCESENNTEDSSGSHEDSDDFVLVPKNLPEDQNVIDYEKK